MRNHKSLGLDNIQSDVIKLIAYDNNIDLRVNLFNKIYNTGVFPKIGSYQYSFRYPKKPLQNDLENTGQLH